MVSKGFVYDDLLSVTHTGLMFELLQMFPIAMSHTAKQKPFSWPRSAAILPRSGVAIAAGLSVSLLFSLPVSAEAAERIRFRYGLYELIVTRAELETFAETGEAEGGLETLLDQLGAELGGQLQGALQANYDLNPVLASRFAQTRSGEQLLTEAGELIQTESGLNGFKGLRAALVLAAAEPDGLTLLSFIEQFPTDIKIDIGQAQAIAKNFGRLLGQTQQAIGQLSAETAALAAAEPAVDFAGLPNPSEPGRLGAVAQTLTLYDEKRDRTIVTDVYVPEAATDSELPVIVVSNGLGAKRDRFTELATHLASHGFAVAIPDHPGSDRERLKNFYQGLEPENFEATEFIDRPKDISFVLDELTRLDNALFAGKLAPENAGVFGYSFGGTTALAIAGAKIDSEHLQQDCETRASLFNISLLYQCRALELPTALLTTDLRDERVQASYVFVPFTRSIYGPEGLSQVEGPVLWEATDKDILTPFVVEQLPAYNWIANSEAERYLAIASGLPHARITQEVLSRITKEESDWETIRPIAEGYHQTLSTAFFQVHIANNEAYRPYLQARGAQYLTQEPYSLTWRESPFIADFIDE